MIELSLSPRQAQIARLLDRGLTQAEVAEQLGLHIRTVEFHVARIRAKTGQDTTRQAIRLARTRARGLAPRS